MPRLKTAFLLSLIYILTGSFAFAGDASPAVKEWTFMTFINGHNDLDSYGASNIKMMEQVGSTQDINIVVQWASLGKKTKRILVQKSTNSSKVTSPSVEELPPVDMGDYRQLIEFVRWSMEKYPAKRYFLNVWNHGSGWHDLSTLGKKLLRDTTIPTDISWDDQTGNHITNEELGIAVREAARMAGGKLAIYGSDACEMQMLEVVGEMRDVVDVVAGSEADIPGEGWPYHTFLKRWAQNPMASSVDIATMLTEEYALYYDSDVTFSALNMAEYNNVVSAFKVLADDILALNKTDKADLIKATSDVQSFTNYDYKDAIHFGKHLLTRRNVGLKTDSLQNVITAMSKMVVINRTTDSYPNALGVSVWFPSDKSTLNSYYSDYLKTDFHKQTNWGLVLKYLNQ